jgi:hypothetical protein
MRLVSSVAFLLISSASAFSQCAILKDGLYDTSFKSSENARAQAFRNWFCQKNYSEQKDANQLKLDAGLPIADIPVQLGFNSKSQNWKVFRSEYCSDSTFYSQYYDKTLDFTRTVNQTVVGAIATCLTQKGLHVWIEQTSDQDTFRFRALWNPDTQKAAIPKIRTLDFEHATCSFKLKRSNNTIDISGKNFLCKRNPSGAAVIVAIEADHSIIEDGRMELPAIPKYDPPPPMKPIYIDKCNLSAAINAGCLTSEYSPGGNILWNGSDVSRSNSATYVFDASGSGLYKLYVTYGSPDSRPVQIEVNPDGDAPQRINNALGGATGCVHETCLVKATPTLVGSFLLRMGENTLRISRDSAFPHIYDISFKPSGASQTAQRCVPRVESFSFGPFSMGMTSFKGCEIQ